MHRYRSDFFLSTVETIEPRDRRLTLDSID